MWAGSQTEASRTLSEAPKKACSANSATMNSNQTLSAEKKRHCRHYVGTDTHTDTHLYTLSYTLFFTYNLTQLENLSGRKTAQHLPGKWKSVAKLEQVAARSFLLLMMWIPCNWVGVSSKRFFLWNIKVSSALPCTLQNRLAQATLYVLYRAKKMLVQKEIQQKNHNMLEARLFLFCTKIFKSALEYS